MSSYIRQIQTLLKDAGYYIGEIDGIAGKMTVQAVGSAVDVILKTRSVSDQQTQEQPLIQHQKSQNGFVLGDGSLKKLVGVNPNLVAVVKRAIQLSDVDFRVTEGLRTKARQTELLKQGKTQTMNSRHLTGHAVDLVAIVNG